MKMLAVFLCIVFVSLGCASPNALVATPDRPNVILMMADDLATEDLSSYGGARIQTPRIDGLAKQGVSLTSYYAGNPVCSPSRMALLSGAYPARLGWRWGVQGYGFKPKTGLSPDVYTIAEAFRDAGYRTAMTGKWHLGSSNMRPEDQGFDSVYCIYMSNNQGRDMYRDGELVKEQWDNRLLSEAFAEEAVRIIHEPGDKPFFVYVPWSAPHFPADPHPDWHGQTGTKRLGKYVDTVRELDYRVGQILDALDKAGKADDTIVVFTSDNGRQTGQQGKDEVPPYSGMKWHSREGGTRVPCIVRYPGLIEAGRSTEHIAGAIDLFPTLAAACGVSIELPEKAQKLDGINLWPMFVGAQGVDYRVRGELLYWHGRGQATAIRIGDWKLFFNEGDKGDPDTSQGPVLYNLKGDVKETTNVAQQNPDRVKAMIARAKDLLTEVYANQVPIGTWQGVEVPDQPVEASEVWGPWIR